MSKTVTCDICGSAGASAYQLQKAERVDYGDGRPKNSRHVYIGAIDLCANCISTRVRLRQRRLPHEHAWYFHDLDGNPFPGICMSCGVLKESA